MKENRKTIIIGTLSVLTLIFLIWFFFIQTKPVMVTFTDKSWEHCIEIEQMETEIEEGWDLPDGARLIRTESRLEEYDTVVVKPAVYKTDPKTGKKTLVRAAVTKQVPDYEDWYTYEIDVWNVFDMECVSGYQADNMLWPEVSPLEEGLREGRRVPVYMMYYTYTNKDGAQVNVDWRTTLATYKKYKNGQVVKGTINRMNIINFKE